MTPLGQLKMEIMRCGVAPDAEVRRRIAGSADVVADLKEVSFSLAPDFLVTARIEAAASAMPLTWKDGRAILDMPAGPLTVTLSPLPDFCIQLQQKSSGRVAGNVCMDGFCLNLYLKVNAPDKKLNRDIPEVLSWVRSASVEGPVNLVQINMEYCDFPDRGFSLLEPLVRAVKRNFRTFVSLRSFPPENLSGLDRVYASGIDVLNLPLEGFPSDESRVHTPGFREHGQRALEYAAGVFPFGAVMTELAFHPENTDALLNRIDLLAQKNILPLLILPTDLAVEHFEVLNATLDHLERAVTRQRLPLKWLYPSARFVSPLDSAFFTDSPQAARLALKPIYKSALGITASEGFAALRRALRVKNISDSYESSGL